MVKRNTFIRLAVTLVVVTFLFLLYTNGLSKNPPGFYVDESGVAYNAYLIAHTGAGEFGRWPLFFQFYTGGFTQWANPTQIYLLSMLFFFIKPSILAARIFSESDCYRFRGFSTETQPSSPLTSRLWGGRRFA